MDRVNALTRRFTPGGSPTSRAGASSSTSSRASDARVATGGGCPFKLGDRGLLGGAVADSGVAHQNSSRSSTGALSTARRAETSGSGVADSAVFAVGRGDAGRRGVESTGRRGGGGLASGISVGGSGVGAGAGGKATGGVAGGDPGIDVVSTSTRSSSAASSSTATGSCCEPQLSSGGSTGSRVAGRLMSATIARCVAREKPRAAHPRRVVRASRSSATKLGQPPRPIVPRRPPERRRPARRGTQRRRKSGKGSSTAGWYLTLKSSKASSAPWMSLPDLSANASNPHLHM